MNGNEIVEAISKLHEAFPKERVDLWVSYERDGSVHYVGYLHGDDGMPDVISRQFEPMAAANDVIAKAGNRDPESIRQQRIAKLRDELAKLESQTPVVMES